MTNLYEDDYPEGIASEAFDVRLDPMTRGQKVMLVIIGATSVVATVYGLGFIFDAFRDWVQS